MKCKTCDGKYNRLFSGMSGECDNCFADTQARHVKSVKDKRLAKSLGITVEQMAAFILTTETSHNLPVTERLGIITAEAVLGMNAFKDLFGGFRDVVGGRSKTLEKGLRDAREICLTELKRTAIKLGAAAVVGIDLDYQDLGKKGNMLMVVATGTAVKLD